MFKLRILVILTILNAVKNSDLKDENLNCVIFNEKYHEYMYAANMFFSRYFKRAIYTFPMGLIYWTKNGKNFDFTEDDRKGVWILEPVNGRKNIYYLKNLKYQEYLYAADKLNKFLFFESNMRWVYTQKKLTPSDEKFMWKFETLHEKGSYHIFNVEHNEPLFANVHLNNENIRRDVLTWYKSPNGMQFKWNVKCRNDASLK